IIPQNRKTSRDCSPKPSTHAPRSSESKRNHRPARHEHSMSDARAQSENASDYAPSGGSAVGTVVAVVAAAVTLPFGESVIG
ncbi:hypothetical protein ABUR84_14520, partial [Staphylococcus aureus]|uniref:hypothetical protein n=1 Tax=Staphylococcus aureus TaxID=1280 RepID=UPI00338F7929